MKLKKGVALLLASAAMVSLAGCGGNSGGSGSNLLIACINHNGNILIPKGQDKIQVGDTVIVVTTIEGLNDLKDILKK